MSFSRRSKPATERIIFQGAAAVCGLLNAVTTSLSLNTGSIEDHRPAQSKTAAGPRSQSRTGVGATAPVSQKLLRNQDRAAIEFGEMRGSSIHDLKSRRDLRREIRSRSI